MDGCGQLGRAITGTTRLLGVIGDPVKHSLSPVMHNAAIAAMGLDYVYVALPVRSVDLGRAIAGFEAIGVVGFNLTIPHKQAILPYLSEVSELARAVGAVNTVWRTETGWVGTNTDVAGFLAPLRSGDPGRGVGQDWSRVRVVVLGNGGAARAVVAGCRELGCGEIIVVGRNPSRLEAFAASWQGSRSADTLRVLPWDQMKGVLSEAGLIVNTTPMGMAPAVEASPLGTDEIAQIQPGAIAYDLIYVPRPTAFLQQAEERGAIAIDGLEMLVQQGAAALAQWTGQPVPVEVMRTALIEHFQNR